MNPNETFCGCCGRQTNHTLWCTDCQKHVLPGLTLHPHQRIYLAQFRRECPFQVESKRVTLEEIHEGILAFPSPIE